MSNSNISSKRSRGKFLRIAVIKKLNKAARVLAGLHNEYHRQSGERVSLVLVKKAIQFVKAENSDAFCAFLEEMETGVVPNETTYSPPIVPDTYLTMEERVRDARDRINFLKTLETATGVVNTIKSGIPRGTAANDSLMLIKDMLLFIMARKLDSFRANAISR